MRKRSGRREARRFPRAVPRKIVVRDPAAIKASINNWNDQFVVRLRALDRSRI